MELLILSTSQSKSLVYTILANASLLTAADSGSSHFVIISSRVTITRLQRESSKAFASHLNKIITSKAAFSPLFFP
uniref:Myosin-6-like isoform X1 n=1 Tax=Rhizophora mucronata TaxID=61149 RepID=A0A2P2MTX6_RHIMU